MVRLRLIEAPLAIPRYRQVRLPAVAAEFTPYADVTINDENVEAVDFSPVDLAGFTAQVYNVDRAVFLSGKFREQGIPTILGGPQATAMPEWALEHFDAVVVGEVEGLGGRIVRDLEAGKLTGIYRNERPPDLASLRPPRRDLQKADSYYHVNFPIELSRGCPHACTFCFNRYQFPVFRTKPLALIEQEISQWDHGMIEAVDLHMAADKKHLIAVCALLERAGVQGWYGECTLASLDDEEVLSALERSNCKQVFVGIESIDPQALKSMAKGFNPYRRYREIIRRIQDHGIFVHAGFIWGLDGATRETYDATLEFCEDAGIYLVSVNLLTYFPGTAAHAQAREEGRLTTQEMRRYDGAHLIVRPKGMEMEEVRRQTRRFLDHFYSFGSIYRRSFQTPNYRLAHLVDYWAFNLLYGAYYRMWGKRLDSDAPPISLGGAAATGEGFPFVGGRMPGLYGLLDKSWRFFERGYRWWDSPPQDASLAVTGGCLFLAAAACVAGLHWLQEAAVRHLPAPWPAPGLAAAAFVPASLVSFWLVHRLSRGKAGGAARAVGLALLLAPLLACALALPAHASGWRFSLGFLTLVFALKAWSLLSTGRPEEKGALRAFSFLFLFPSLEFDRSFQPLTRKRPLVYHFPTQVWAFWKFLLGWALFVGIVLATIGRMDVGALRPLFVLGKLLVLYLWLSGGIDYWAAYWRMAGYEVPAAFDRPLALEGPARLWRGWNVPLRRWLVRHVYVPLGGERRPFLATVGTFLASGLLFEGLFGLAGRQFTGGALGFFLAHGVAVGLDKKYFEEPEGTARGFSRRLLAFAVTAALFFATAPWLFQETDRIFQ